MEILHSVKQWFWNPDVWLVPGISWDDMAPTQENGLPDSKDLFPAMVYMTVLFLVIRYLILEPMIIKPFGRLFGLKDITNKNPPFIEEAEELFQLNKNKKASHNDIIEVAQKIGWSERQVERWLRHRTLCERPSKMFKLCDCCWNLIYYIFYCVYGLWVLYDKEWLWDIKECWTGYPFQSVSKDLWWYYILSLGYYTTMSLTHMFQHKRKDSLQMLLHHLVTLVLIFLSFNVNMIRLGSLILLVHECADIPLLTAKVCGYVGHGSAMDFLFIIFILLWVITRLYLYPFWIMKNALFDAHRILNTMAPVYYIFNGLLVILLLFHLVWTFFILQIILKKIKTKETRDLRSDDEDLSKDFLDNCNYTYIEKDDHWKKK
ncbi:UNVERIFIED_CONTAM: hypothetical protein RMT77_007698 [Armadillidium vulgare]|nr:Ceramide synthase 2 [Armadillidium vulgare]